MSRGSGRPSLPVRSRTQIRGPGRGPGRGHRSAEPELRRAAWTIGVQAGVLLVAVLALFAVLVVLIVARSQQQQTTDVLEEAISVTHGDGRPRSDGDDVEVRAVAVAVQDPSGYRVDGVLPPGLPDRGVMATVRRTGTVDQRTVELGDRHYTLRTDQHGDDTIQAVLDLSEQRAELTRLVQAMLVAGLSGMLLVAGASVLLTGRAIRPMADALAMQRRFVSDAAHELRTPLTLLSTRAQLLARRLRRRPTAAGPLGTDDQEDLDGLVADAATLTAILEELLLAADLRSAPVEDVDLTVLVTSVVSSARGHAAELGIELSVGVAAAGGAAMIVRGSRPALTRAVTALLDNAVGHARHRVEVEVGPAPRGRRSAGRRRLTICDDGPGIRADRLPELFERFAGQRVEGSGRRHYGLGLSLVSEIVARYGGSVHAENRTDAPGARFTVDLPTGRPGPARDQAAEPV